VVLMKQGLVWAAGAPAKLLDNEELDRLYEADLAPGRLG
jgi:ABC-type hemin transport system ATPase subunit